MTAELPPFPISTVGALIFNPGGRALMIRTHKWSNLWGIPGGKIKLNETSEAALHRELIEETALRVRDVEFIMVQDCVAPSEFHRPAHFLLLNYTCRTEDSNVVLNNEAEEFQWLPLQDALGIALNKPTRILIEAVLRRRNRSPGVIHIADLAVLFHVGVPDAERARPQRLLLDIRMEHDFSAAASSDDLAATINYSAVCQRLRQLGNGRAWKLIETLAEEIAALILHEFKPSRVRVEVKKFIIPETRHISVTVDRSR